VMRSSFLPAPMHTAPSFLNFSFLSIADKLAVTRALIPLTLKKQRDNGTSFGDWLKQHGQTPGAVSRFWNPILVSALSEELDREDWILDAIPAGRPVVDLPACHWGSIGSDLRLARHPAARHQHRKRLSSRS